MEPVTLSLVVSGTALGGITLALTTVLTLIKVLQRVDNTFKISDKIKAKLQEIKDKRKTKREKKKAVEELVSQLPDLADRLKRVESVKDDHKELSSNGDITISANVSSNETSDPRDVSSSGIDPASLPASPMLSVSNSRNNHASVDVKVRNRYPHL